jgi:hypothetical protein
MARHVLSYRDAMLHHLENAVMLEFLTPEMAADYLAAVRPN